MSGSIFGKNFQISTFGESHGKALGVTIDGCPSGIPLDTEDIQRELDRRKPGTSKYQTKRAETDKVEILSGVFENKTTGTPISLVVFNQDQRSKDYKEIAQCYRPGHADYCFDQKYGFRDYRGGGRSSGRETLARVAAGAVAKKILAALDITVTAYTEAIGPVSIQTDRFDIQEALQNPLCMPDHMAYEQAAHYLDTLMQEENSSGGVIACFVTGLPAGIGEPVFDKLDANLAKAIFSIGAVKGLEFGSGFMAAKSTGYENNDAFCLSPSGNIQKGNNHAGGVLGGMSDGSALFFRAAIKPTPSIHKLQKTVTKTGQETTIAISGRHDPVIVPRAVVVVEAMTAITLVDLLFQNMLSQMDGICRFYQK